MKKRLIDIAVIIWIMAGFTYILPALVGYANYYFKPGPNMPAPPSEALPAPPDPIKDTATYIYRGSIDGRRWIIYTQEQVDSFYRNQRAPGFRLEKMYKYFEKAKLYKEWKPQTIPTYRTARLSSARP